jgi:hypothetical protein
MDVLLDIHRATLELYLDLKVGKNKFRLFLAHSVLYQAPVMVWSAILIMQNLAGDE